MKYQAIGNAMTIEISDRIMKSRVTVTEIPCGDCLREYNFVRFKERPPGVTSYHLIGKNLKKGRIGIVKVFLNKLLVFILVKSTWHIDEPDISLHLRVILRNLWPEWYLCNKPCELIISLGYLR